MLGSSALVKILSTSTMFWYCTQSACVLSFSASRFLTPLIKTLQLLCLDSIFSLAISDNTFTIKTHVVWWLESCTRDRGGRVFDACLNLWVGPYVSVQVKDGSHVLIWKACKITHNQYEPGCRFRLHQWEFQYANGSITWLSITPNYHCLSIKVFMSISP